jgi:hypothetical protein
MQARRVPTSSGAMGRRMVYLNGRGREPQSEAKYVTVVSEPAGAAGPQLSNQLRLVRSRRHARQRVALMATLKRRLL